jgi:hypothetical protein
LPSGFALSCSCFPQKYTGNKNIAYSLLLESVKIFSSCVRHEPAGEHQVREVRPAFLQGRVGKNPVFLNPAQWVFLIFWVFFGVFLVFFGGDFLYNCPEERVFRVF